jgi:intracellular septation protein
MQLLFDFLPVIAFFAAYKLSGSIFVATAVIIVAVILQTTIQWVRHRKVSSMALISGVLVLVFGGLTLLIHDKAFIQWKVTVVNWLFAIAFIASRYFGDRTIIERLLGENLQLEPALWRRLNWAWGLFFLALGAINLYVAYNYPEAVWVNFKLFGVLGLTIVFALVQGFWLAAKSPPSAESN